MTLRIYGNRALKTLPGQATRPTPARVREALFNIWQTQVLGCRWLDLCAGSGAMGAEALCRGASEVVGIEQSGKACAVITENWRRVAKPDQTFRVLRGNVCALLPKLAGQQFDCIYFDPPYASDLYPLVLVAIAQYALLAPSGDLAVEHRCDQTLPEEIIHDPIDSDNLSIHLYQYRQKIYGSTAISFYHLNEGSGQDKNS